MDNDDDQKKDSIYQHSSTYTLGGGGGVHGLSPPSTKLNPTTTGGGKMKLHVQGTSGIIKGGGNPAFAIKPSAGSNSSPLKTGGKAAGGGLIYPSYHLS